MNFWDFLEHGSTGAKVLFVFVVILVVSGLVAAAQQFGSRSKDDDEDEKSAGLPVDKLTEVHGPPGGRTRRP